MRIGLLAATALAGGLFPILVAVAQQGDGTEVRLAVNVFKPAKIEPTTDRIAQIKAPPGFKVEPFASGLQNARIVAVSEDGTVYVSRRDQGDVLMLKDEDGDGRADKAPVTVANRSGAHGLAIKDGLIYLGRVKEVSVLVILEDGTPSRLYDDYRGPAGRRPAS